MYRTITLAALLVTPWIVSSCTLTTHSTTVSTTPNVETSVRFRPTGVVSGVWVYENATTRETLRLHQATGGGVYGSGTAVGRNTHGRSGSFSIEIRKGTIHGNTLSLTIYVTQAFGLGLTVIQNLQCHAVPSILHCRTTTPLYSTTVFQDFHRV